MNDRHPLNLKIEGFYICNFELKPDLLQYLTFMGPEGWISLPVCLCASGTDARARRKCENYKLCFAM